jgi:homoserine kinase
VKATAFAPGSIGNVGPGFDVLGLAVEGIGDRVTVELTPAPSRVAGVSGRDATLVPRDPARNSAAIAAIAWLRAHGDSRNVIVTIDKGLPLAGGLGGSAASSVAGAYAAAIAGGFDPQPLELISAALEGETAVAGRHLDNIAASVFGGLALSRSIDPIDAVAISVREPWWVALATPAVRVQTKAARAMLPETWPRTSWVQQMANTTALAHAFECGDSALLGRALDDRYAEPFRANLIPHFLDVKRAAFLTGAFGCSISGSGPTVFAITADEATAQRCAAAMQTAFGEIASTAHVGPIARQGVRAVDPERSEGSTAAIDSSLRSE